MMVVAVSPNHHSGRALAGTRAAISTRRNLCRIELLIFANAAAPKVVGRADRAIEPVTIGSVAVMSMCFRTVELPVRTAVGTASWTLTG